jgi:hypothetical protein
MARPRLRALRETFSLVTQTDPNQYGKAYGLTTLLPIVAGHTDALEAHLDGLDVDDSPLARLPQLHMSRLHVIRDLVYQGKPQIPETLDHHYLIFTASIDGDIDVFLQDFARLLGPDADAIFSHIIGFPGTGDPAAFARWVLEHKRDNGYFLSPWPFETVPRVHEALRVQAGFGDLATRAGELSDADLQAEFRALMAGQR